MQKHRFRKYLRVALAALCGVIVLSPPARQLAVSPGEINLPLGQGTVVPIGLPVKTEATCSNRQVVNILPIRSRDLPAISVTSTAVGDTTVRTRLFGVVPWKTVHVHVVPQEMVYVGGQSIGVNLHAKGVIVVGFQSVNGQRSPAAAAHVQVGDVIESVNHIQLQDTSQLQSLVQSTESPLQLTIRRGDEHQIVLVHPVRDSLGTVHLGLFVRDTTAGVGTLTFYEPTHHRFGALGHMITDVDTGQPIVGTGSVYEAEVTGMVKGLAGKPGEKRGRFDSHTAPIGHIDENTPFGVFGTMDALPRFAYANREYPVALPEQVRDGPAELLTVLNGHTVQAFHVNIEVTQDQTQPETKSMVIHVTDPRLLQQAGGIVQGMSGSPLIQDGKLIGAVTHVFVSDPTRGYGVYAEWMLHEAEHETEEETHAVSNFVG
ncbi:SpoIVB peptidase [Alicyclobacillus cycloheptanicus]|uniref:Stage IV sporulation protein B n=1 Tax=Alicyclobacillus cycloheptanicus TaxID=1457 RepID=A0ABT9XE06_9BACL|nr:SpoIVB peptidase [Alicyclobacillus cycloheptanicus]MDQ0188375.1 stage IV sporulation protein B [Alicyclobacillus cycloheptanicus]WDM01081.1 SpoIVB peptidase [Alicyclobacillus cycloheptanicus]